MPLHVQPGMSGLLINGGTASTSVLHARTAKAPIEDREPNRDAEAVNFHMGRSSCLESD